MDSNQNLTRCLFLDTRLTGIQAIFPKLNYTPSKVLLDVNTVETQSFFCNNFAMLGVKKVQSIAMSTMT